MSWSTPKTDWGVDVVGSNDMNRIEGNTVSLHKGNGHTSLAIVNPNASGQLQINETDETFVIDDSTYSIGLILTENRQPGNKIILLADSCTPQFVNTGTPTGDYKSIKIFGGGTHTMSTDGLVMLVYYNSYWYLGVLEP